MIEKGSPIVQVIRFRRDSAEIGAEVPAERLEERAERDRVLRNSKSTDGWYRTEAGANR